MVEPITDAESKISMRQGLLYNSGWAWLSLIPLSSRSRLCLLELSLAPLQAGAYCSL